MSDTSNEKSRKSPNQTAVGCVGCLGIIAVLALIAIAATVFSGGKDDDEKDATESTSSEPTKFTVEHEDDIPGGTTWVRFDIADNFTQGLIASGAQNDTCKALEEGFSAYPDSARVANEGSFPTTDDHGNEEDSVILRPVYEQATYEKINMENCQTIDVWDVRDGGMINEQLLENR